jgi:hypothetical protein
MYNPRVVPLKKSTKQSSPFFVHTGVKAEKSRKTGLMQGNTIFFSDFKKLSTASLSFHTLNDAVRRFMSRRARNCVKSTLEVFLSSTLCRESDTWNIAFHPNSSTVPTTVPYYYRGQNNKSWNTTSSQAPLPIGSSVILYCCTALYHNLKLPG